MHDPTYLPLIQLDHVTYLTGCEVISGNEKQPLERKTINTLVKPSWPRDIELENILAEISSAIANLDGLEKVQGLVRKGLSRSIPVSDIVEKGLRKGLEQVGAKYEASEYFLAELLFAASMMDGAMQTLRPELERQAIQKRGTILLGTVRGDIHDIGKNIFKMLA
jgi:methanogenic corrinoid protein MtbC1